MALVRKGEVLPSAIIKPPLISQEQNQALKSNLSLNHCNCCSTLGRLCCDAGHVRSELAQGSSEQTMESIIVQGQQSGIYESTCTYNQHKVIQHQLPLPASDLIAQSSIEISVV